MPDQRALGQDVQVLIVNNGDPLATLTAIKSMDVTFKFEPKEDGFLGETTDRHDEVFKGIDGKVDFQLESKDIVDLIVAARDRSRRRQAGIKFNIKATINFPNGDTPRLIFPDVHWKDIPLNFAGRTEFGTVSLPFSCDDFEPIS